MRCLSHKVNEHKLCRFCEWTRQWDEWKKSKGKARCIEKTDNEDFAAVLEKYPRIDGEVLIISTRHDSEAYNDVSDISKFSENEKNNLIRILNDTIKLMKDHLKAEKVYLYSFCEHWERNEIAYRDKKTTEHLHFHLLPRYKPLRLRELAAEKIFDIPTKRMRNSDLYALKRRLLE
jgi:diadenosine tetraphosphate (Ap4A) HIT family hydrolase